MYCATYRADILAKQFKAIKSTREPSTAGASYTRNAARRVAADLDLCSDFVTVIQQWDSQHMHAVDPAVCFMAFDSLCLLHLHSLSNGNLILGYKSGFRGTRTFSFSSRSTLSVRLHNGYIQHVTSFANVSRSTFSKICQYKKCAFDGDRSCSHPGQVLGSPQSAVAQVSTPINGC